ncbi:U3 snoRNP protein [Coemansia sp. RSA 1085]|nr:U3 snoRNP protein [Coemansia sp. RSA 1085]
MAGRSAIKRKHASTELATQKKHSRKSEHEAVEHSDSDESMGVSDGEDMSDHMDEDEPKLAGENSTAKSTERRPGQTVTNAEIMALNEASLLFKTNLFKLQVDELLNETMVTSGSKATRDLDAALKQIRDVLVAMESTKEMSVEAAVNHVRKLSKSKFSVPFPDPAPPADLPIKMAFDAPEVVNIVGSYALGMAVRTGQGFSVDMMAQMPASLFQERDHLNFRYFYKRAFFVAMVRVLLQKSAVQDAFDVDFDLLRSDTRLPIVVLRPKPDMRRLAKLNCSVRIIPTIAPDTLPLKRLAPGRNHVRFSFLARGASDGEVDELPPTPQYNAALVSDALLTTHITYLHETKDLCAEFARAAALLRIWHSQHSSSGRSVGSQHLMRSRMNGFILTMVLAWLVRSANSGGVSGARLSTAMTAHQLFKGTIEFLAIHDFASLPAQFSNSVDIVEFAQGGAALVDPTASVNLLAGVAPWELTELRMQAQRTARDLNHHSASCFDSVFLSTALSDVVSKYDHILRVEVDLEVLLTTRVGDVDAQKRLYELEHGHPVIAAQSRISKVLNSALAHYTRLISVHAASSIFDSRTKLTRRHVFFIGVVANSESRRLVDLGPSPDAEPQEAARFRALWGRKAELRRFRDGSIRLATVWGTNKMPQEKRAFIVPRMMAFLLQRHFAIYAQPDILLPEDKSALDMSPQMESADPMGAVFELGQSINEFASTRDLSASDTDRVTFEAALIGFDGLQKEIKGLEDKLPLRVLALHPVAPGLRYSSLAPPKPLSVEHGNGDDAYIEPLHVLLEFTSSTKWPDDIAALHKVKTAFLLRVAECYREAHPAAQVDVCNRFFGYSAADGLLTGISPTQLASGMDDFDYERDSFVDIRHAQSGLTFRISLLCSPEGALLERKVQEMKRAKLTPQADALESAYRRWTRTNQWRAMHHRQILDLCQRHHPAASLTIRLLKRWLSRHMLLGQSVGVPEEVAELIAARIFTDSWNGLAAPKSGLTGFIRCLQLLADWRWKEDLCVVDFAAASNGIEDQQQTRKERIWAPTEGLAANEYAVVQAKFDERAKTSRIKDELRIVTLENPDAEWWGTVSVVLTRRLRSLAKAALSVIHTSVGVGSDTDLPQVFTTPMSDYSFVLKLDKSVVCRQFDQPPSLVQPTHAEKPETKEIFKNLLPDMQQAQAFRVKQHSNLFGQPNMVGFDPVSLFVRDLVNVYRDSILFFYDMYGGRHIAGLWNPAFMKNSPFAATLDANMMPVPDEKVGSKPAVVVNKQAVIEEIIRLGEGLVEDCVVQE